MQTGPRRPRQGSAIWATSKVEQLRGTLVAALEMSTRAAHVLNVAFWVPPQACVPVLTQTAILNFADHLMSVFLLAVTSACSPGARHGAQRSLFSTSSGV